MNSVLYGTRCSLGEQLSHLGCCSLIGNPGFPVLCPFPRCLDFPMSGLVGGPGSPPLGFFEH